VTYDEAIQVAISALSSTEVSDDAGEKRVLAAMIRLEDLRIVPTVALEDQQWRSQ
jgi:hypothetical protein